MANGEIFLVQIAVRLGGDPMLCGVVGVYTLSAFYGENWSLPPLLPLQGLMAPSQSSGLSPCPLAKYNGVLKKPAPNYLLVGQIKMTKQYLQDILFVF